MFRLTVYLLFAGDGSNTSENTLIVRKALSVVKIFLITGSNEL